VEPSIAILEKDRHGQILARSASVSASLVGCPIAFQGIRKSVVTEGKGPPGRLHPDK
jgi:hypothetical protein